jgi:ThiF family protein
MSEAELSFQAEVLRDDDPGARRRLDELRADDRIEIVDHRAELLDSLSQLRPAPRAAITDEPTRWAYYPWRRALVGILGPLGYRALRLDRNRNLITAEEQGFLGALQIGVAGLSVGHAIAYALAQQGLCGRLRLADFDHLELSNLNRVPASVLDVGLNKAVVTARRIAELDPYLDVEVMTAGVTPELVDDFLAGLDVVVEECDSFEMKIMLRESARTLRLPVVMATSDRGLVDVERFDTEPDRPILHGLLGNVGSAELAGLSRHDRIPFMLRHLDASRSSQRLTASLVELDNTLSTWPQLAGDVILGAATVAEAVRRIGLGEPLQSGQVRIDVGSAFDGLGADLGAQAPPQTAGPANDAATAAPPTEPVDLMAYAAIRAPSGGNAQPWTVETHGRAVVVEIDPQYTSMMDVGFRGSAVAVGAAVFNARVAAAARGVLGSVTWTTAGPSPLSATVTLGAEEDPALAALYESMLHRETNRRLGAPQPIADDVVAALHDAASAEGARLSLLTDRDVIDQTATIFGAADRIRYLTPHLHRELIGELRWPGADFPDSGIDVRSLELDEGDLAVLEIIKRPDVMAQLAKWDAGDALGDDVRKRVRSSSGLAVLTVTGHELPDFARGGSAVEAVWIQAQRAGLAVQPISPVFLHAVHDTELDELSPAFATALRRLQSDFRTLAGTKPHEAQVLVMRLAHAGAPSQISRRRQHPSDV